MKDLAIVVDRRCCNQKKVPINDFQEKIQNKLSMYEVKFTYYNSSTDAFCTQGHTKIDFINTSKEEQLNVENSINTIFNALANI